MIPINPHYDCLQVCCKYGYCTLTTQRPIDDESYKNLLGWFLELITEGYLKFISTDQHVPLGVYIHRYTITYKGLWLLFVHDEKNNET